MQVNSPASCKSDTYILRKTNRIDIAIKMKCKTKLQGNRTRGGFRWREFDCTATSKRTKRMGSLSRKITKLRKYNILFQIIRKFLLIENGLIRYIVLLPRRYSPDIRSGRPNQVCPQRLTFKFIHGLSEDN